MRSVVVISGSAENDSKYLGAVPQMQKFEGRVELMYWTGLPMEEMEKRLAALPPHTVILYLTVNRDGSGVSFTPTEALARIAKASQVPVYVMADRFIGGGALGGFVVSLDEEARKSPCWREKFWRGKACGHTGPCADTNRYELDWRQLRRWGFDQRKPSNR
jgi:hypothetical protein